jgi:hypothetical protein
MAAYAYTIYRRLREEDREFEPSLDYVVRPCLKKQKAKQTTTKNLTELLFCGMLFEKH